MVHKYRVTLHILFKGGCQKVGGEIIFLLGRKICFEICHKFEMTKYGKGNENRAGN